MKRRKKRLKPEPFDFEFDVTFDGEAEVTVQALDEDEAKKLVERTIEDALNKAGIMGHASNFRVDDPRVYEKPICAICGVDRRDADGMNLVEQHFDYDTFRDTAFPFKNAEFVCPKHLMRPAKTYLKDLRMLWENNHWTDNTPERIFKRRSRRATA